jgi:putative hydrolase of the HAD superfamily
MIKGIIFDWFGVCTTENWGDCVQRELAKKLNMSEEKIKKEYKSLLQDFMKTKLSKEEFFEKFISALDSSKNSNEFFYLLEIIPDLNTELLEFIKNLKKQYKIYLLSNNVSELFEQYEKKINFNDYFDLMFLSHELKISKTQDEIWDVLLSKVNCRPEELLFIDNKESYLEFARKRGIKTILFKNNEQVKKEINKLKPFTP